MSGAVGVYSSFNTAADSYHAKSAAAPTAAPSAYSSFGVGVGGGVAFAGASEDEADAAGLPFSGWGSQQLESRRDGDGGIRRQAASAAEEAPEGPWKIQRSGGGGSDAEMARLRAPLSHHSVGLNERGTPHVPPATAGAHSKQGGLATPSKLSAFAGETSAVGGANVCADDATTGRQSRMGEADTSGHPYFYSAASAPQYSPKVRAAAGDEYAHSSYAAAAASAKKEGSPSWRQAPRRPEAATQWQRPAASNGNEPSSASAPTKWGQHAAAGARGLLFASPSSVADNNGAADDTNGDGDGDDTYESHRNAEDEKDEEGGAAAAADRFDPTLLQETLSDRVPRASDGSVPLEELHQCLILLWVPSGLKKSRRLDPYFVPKGEGQWRVRKLTLRITNTVVVMGEDEAAARGGNDAVEGVAVESTGMGIGGGGGGMNVINGIRTRIVKEGEVTIRKFDDKQTLRFVAPVHTLTQVASFSVPPQFPVPLLSATAYGGASDGEGEGEGVGEKARGGPTGASFASAHSSFAADGGAPVVAPKSSGGTLEIQQLQAGAKKERAVVKKMRSDRRRVRFTCGDIGMRLISAEGDVYPIAMPSSAEVEAWLASLREIIRQHEHDAAFDADFDPHRLRGGNDNKSSAPLPTATFAASSVGAGGGGAGGGSPLFGGNANMREGITSASSPLGSASPNTTAEAMAMLARGGAASLGGAPLTDKERMAALVGETEASRPDTGAFVTSFLAREIKARSGNKQGGALKSDVTIDAPPNGGEVELLKSDGKSSTNWRFVAAVAGQSGNITLTKISGSALTRPVHALKERVGAARSHTIDANDCDVYIESPWASTVIALMSRARQQSLYLECGSLDMRIAWETWLRLMGATKVLSLEEQADAMDDTKSVRSGWNAIGAGDGDDSAYQSDTQSNRTMALRPDSIAAAGRFVQSPSGRSVRRRSLSYAGLEGVMFADDTFYDREAEEAEASLRTPSGRRRRQSLSASPSGGGGGGGPEMWRTEEVEAIDGDGIYLSDPSRGLFNTDAVEKFRERHASSMVVPATPTGHINNNNSSNNNINNNLSSSGARLSPRRSSILGGGGGDGRSPMAPSPSSPYGIASPLSVAALAAHDRSTAGRSLGGGRGAVSFLLGDGDGETAGDIVASRSLPRRRIGHSNANISDDGADSEVNAANISGRSSDADAAAPTSERSNLSTGSHLPSEHRSKATATGSPLSPLGGAEGATAAASAFSTMAREEAQLQRLLGGPGSTGSPKGGGLYDESSYGKRKGSRFADADGDGDGIGGALYDTLRELRAEHQMDLLASPAGFARATEALSAAEEAGRREVASAEMIGRKNVERLLRTVSRGAGGGGALLPPLGDDGDYDPILPPHAAANESTAATQEDPTLSVDARKWRAMRQQQQQQQYGSPSSPERGRHSPRGDGGSPAPSPRLRPPPPPAVNNPPTLDSIMMDAAASTIIARGEEGGNGTAKRRTRRNNNSGGGDHNLVVNNRISSAVEGTDSEGELTEEQLSSAAYHESMLSPVPPTRRTKARRGAENGSDVYSEGDADSYDDDNDNGSNAHRQLATAIAGTTPARRNNPNAKEARGDPEYVRAMRRKLNESNANVPPPTLHSSPSKNGANSSKLLEGYDPAEGSTALALGRTTNADGIAHSDTVADRSSLHAVPLATLPSHVSSNPSGGAYHSADSTVAIAGAAAEAKRREEIRRIIKVHNELRERTLRRGDALAAANHTDKNAAADNNGPIAALTMADLEADGGLLPTVSEIITSNALSPAITAAERRALALEAQLIAEENSRSFGTARINANLAGLVGDAEALRRRSDATAAAFAKGPVAPVRPEEVALLRLRMRQNLAGGGGGGAGAAASSGGRVPDDASMAAEARRHADLITNDASLPIVGSGGGANPTPTTTLVNFDTAYGRSAQLIHPVVDADPFGGQGGSFNAADDAASTLNAHRALLRSLPQGRLMEQSRVASSTTLQCPRRRAGEPNEGGDSDASAASATGAYGAPSKEDPPKASATSYIAAAQMSRVPIAYCDANGVLHQPRATTAGHHPLQQSANASVSAYGLHPMNSMNMNTFTARGDGVNGNDSSHYDADDGTASSMLLSTATLSSYSPERARVRHARRSADRPTSPQPAAAGLNNATRHTTTMNNTTRTGTNGGGALVNGTNLSSTLENALGFSFGFTGFSGSTHHQSTSNAVTAQNNNGASSDVRGNGNASLFPSAMSRTKGVPMHSADGGEDRMTGYLATVGNRSRVGSRAHTEAVAAATVAAPSAAIARANTRCAICGEDKRSVAICGTTGRRHVLLGTPLVTGAAASSVANYNGMSLLPSESGASVHSNAAAVSAPPLSRSTVGGKGGGEDVGSNVSASLAATPPPSSFGGAAATATAAIEGPPRGVGATSIAAPQGHQPTAASGGQPALALAYPLASGGNAPLGVASGAAGDYVTGRNRHNTVNISGAALGGGADQPLLFNSSQAHLGADGHFLASGGCGGGGFGYRESPSAILPAADGLTSFVGGGVPNSTAMLAADSTDRIRQRRLML